MSVTISFLCCGFIFTINIRPEQHSTFQHITLIFNTRQGCSCIGLQPKPINMSQRQHNYRVVYSPLPHDSRGDQRQERTKTLAPGLQANTRTDHQRLSQTRSSASPDVMNVVCDSTSKNILLGNLMMHMKTKIHTEMAHFVPLPPCNNPCLVTYELLKSKFTWCMCKCVLVLDLKLDCRVASGRLFFLTKNSFPKN